MKNRKPKLIVITGPTAAGKTDLSLKLAKKFQGEIISADSRQVYRHLDVGTDKIFLDKEGKNHGIKHHLIDVANPNRTFTVADFQKLAGRATKKIHASGKIPFLVGGSPFYIEALLYNLNLPEVKPNSKLRKSLEKFSAEILFKKLLSLDPERASAIDRHNKRRLIRALEIATKLGIVPKITKRTDFDVLFLGVKKSDSELRKRINGRVDKRVEKIIREIRRLLRMGVSAKKLISLGLEYRFFTLYLQKKITKPQATEELKKATWRFARRQYTFFKRFPMTWIRNQREAETKIKKFLKK